MGEEVNECNDDVVECNATVGWAMNGWVRKLMNAMKKLLNVMRQLAGL